LIAVFPEFPHGGFVVLADAGQHHAALLQAQQRFVQAEIQSDEGKRAADFRRPGKRTAGLRQHARPQCAVEVEDDALLAPDPRHGDQRVDVLFRNHRLAAIGVAAKALRQRRRIREDAVYRRLLAFQPLQQPSRRAEMREPDLAIVEQALGAGRGQSGRDIDDVDIGEGGGEFRQRHIGETEARPVPLDAAFGEAERLHRRLG
jgi:hypothetical protein